MGHTENEPTVGEDFLEALEVKMVTFHIKTVLNAWLSLAIWGNPHITLKL